MFAYGQKYLTGKGNMFLLYPQTENFTKSISSSFCYGTSINPDTNGEDKLNLWIVPVDLSNRIDDEKRIIWPETHSLITNYLKI